MITFKVFSIGMFFVFGILTLTQATGTDIQYLTCVIESFAAFVFLLSFLFIAALEELIRNVRCK